MLALAEKLTTADELFRLPVDGFRYELLQGEVQRMSPTGLQHGMIAGEVGRLLANFVRAHRLGTVLAAETGFLLATDPDTVRAPDVAFLAAGRTDLAHPAAGYFAGAPDLAVEVLSPSDSAAEVEAKVQDFLAAGTRLVWVVNPKTRTVTAFRSKTDIQILGSADLLEGAPVLAGFAVRVAELFES
jgi:Uma2 family endonuclease